MTETISTTELSSTWPYRAQHVVERLVDGELVLYDPQRQYVHALNPTAAFAWLACDGQHRESDIVSALAEHYPENRGDIERDVPTILEMFRAEGLLVV